MKTMAYIGFNDALGEAFYAEFEKFALDNLAQMKDSFSCCPTAYISPLLLSFFKKEKKNFRKKRRRVMKKKNPFFFMKNI